MISRIFLGRSHMNDKGHYHSYDMRAVPPEDLPAGPPRLKACHFPTPYVCPAVSHAGGVCTQQGKRFPKPANSKPS